MLPGMRRRRRDWVLRWLFSAGIAAMTNDITLPPAGPPPSATADFFHGHLTALAAGRLKKPASALDPATVPALEREILKVMRECETVGCGDFYGRVRARHRHVHQVLAGLRASGAIARSFMPVIISGAAPSHDPIYSLARPFFKDAGAHPITLLDNWHLVTAEDFCPRCWCFGLDGEIEQPASECLAAQPSDQAQWLKPTDHFLSGDVGNGTIAVFPPSAICPGGAS